MPRNYKLTRPELKRQQDLLTRFTRYLPMLKLKQQQLQLTVRQQRKEVWDSRIEYQRAAATFEPYAGVLVDNAGLNILELTVPTEVLTESLNVAGIQVPTFTGARFREPEYSLFATPSWVDRTLTQMRQISHLHAKVDVLEASLALLTRELSRVLQRVNLFEKVKIPECETAIRRIRIHLGDEMTAAVARAKIAKNKLTEEKSKEHSLRADREHPHEVLEEGGP